MKTAETEGVIPYIILTYMCELSWKHVFNQSL